MAILNENNSQQQQKYCSDHHIYEEVCFFLFFLFQSILLFAFYLITWSHNLVFLCPVVRIIGSSF